MKATGVVRRLDDLGRLVIPKEIRKQYRLKEGDSIEFFTENEQIIIQKYDVLSKHMEEVELMVEALEKMYGEKVLFMQEDWLIKHHYIVHESFLKQIQTRRVKKFEQQKVFKDDTRLKKGYIFPIVAYGDWFGAFVIVFENEEKTLEQLQAIQAYCELLTRQQQQ